MHGGSRDEHKDLILALIGGTFVLLLLTPFHAV
jgi:hypothetical protein